MLRGVDVLTRVLVDGLGEGFFGVAVGRGRGRVAFFGLGRKALVLYAFQVGVKLGYLVLDAQDGGRVTGQLKRLGHDQRHRLQTEQNIGRVQRPERRASRRDFILVAAVQPGH